MEFDNSFEVPLPAAEAWGVLMDIERIVPCVPGAELTEVVDKDNFKGKVSVRLGPGLRRQGRSAHIKSTEWRGGKRSVASSVFGNCRW